MNQIKNNPVILPENSIVMTANTPGDASMMHMGASLSKEYERLGWRVVGAMENNLSICGQFPYIVFNRVGVLPFGDQIQRTNLNLLQTWVGDPSKFVTYYMDDLLMHMNNNAPLEYMKRCENVVVSNEVLKNYVEESCYIPDARIVRTHVNYDFVDNIKPCIWSPAHKESFTILWGSLGRVGLSFLEEVCNIMNDDPRFYDIALFCVSMNAIKVRTRLIKFRNLHIYYHEAVNLDMFYALAKTCQMIVNPVSMDALVDFYQDPEMQKLWLSAKCEPKFAGAGALRLPLLSGNMRAYTEAIEDGKTGFLSDDPEEWTKIILELKENPELRDYIGMNARHIAETKYDYKQRTLEYIAAFTQREDENEPDLLG